MSNEQTEALKPCPFCGHEAHAWIDVSTPPQREAGYGPRQFLVSCKADLECEATVGGFPTEEAAVEAWNTRAPSDTLEGCDSCGGLNTSCPDGCQRDPKTGELIGSTDTLERREAINKLRRVRDNLTPGAIERADLDGMAFDIDAAILALSLPAREVSGELEAKRQFARFLVTHSKAMVNAPATNEPGMRIIGFKVDLDDFRANPTHYPIACLKALVDLALATTPAPREKLEADLVEAKKALRAILDAPMIDHSRPERSAYGIARATLNRLSGEG